MSELARNEYDEEWTAFRLKDEYLRTGRKFEYFVCAYCNTEVTPAAVYGSDFEKAPYFRLADNEKAHLPECPYGTRGFAAYGIMRAAPRRHEFEVDLPERLVPIRPPQNVGALRREKPTERASPEEVRRRVGAGAATAKIANQYTTSLLKTLADARKAAIASIYKLPRISAIVDPKVRTKNVFELLRTCPLDVYGTKLNYDKAFHKTRHVPWEGNFIYYGDATVQESDDGFVLTSTDVIPGTVPTARICVFCDKTNPVNRMEERTVNALSKAVTAGTTVQWYAYGAFALNAGKTAYKLPVTLPEHISV
jgi:hypothetical protein